MSERVYPVISPTLLVNGQPLTSHGHARCPERPPVPLFDTELRSKRGCFAICLPSCTDEPKVLRFRERMLEQTRQDGAALAELRQRLKQESGGEHHV